MLSRINPEPIFKNENDFWYWYGAAVGFILGILITLFNMWVWGYL